MRCAGLLHRWSRLSTPRARVLASLSALLLASGSSTPAAAAVIDFDDIDHSTNTNLTNSSYADLTWETGNAGYGGNSGYWIAGLSPLHSHARSQPSNVSNAWGATIMGISFSDYVDVVGAYFAGQGDSESWTTGVRVRGYRDTWLVGTTDWLSDIDGFANWLAIDLSGVNRIEIESIAVIDGGGWYGMDDLTYEVATVVPEPMSLHLLGLGCLALAAHSRRRTR